MKGEEYPRCPTTADTVVAHGRLAIPQFFARKGAAVTKRVKIILLGTCCGLLALGRWPSPSLNVFGQGTDSTDQLTSGNAEAFPNTTVSAHLEEPIVAGKNVLWCATFQLAWNEACARLGQDIHTQDEPPMVAILDKKAVSRDDVDEASSVAMAGWIGQGITDQIRQAVEQKFPGESPTILPSSGRPTDLIAYAFLLKNLEFPVPFEKPDDPLTFKGTDVAAFGVSADKADQEQMREQVSILSYRGTADFVIELKTKSTGDQLILVRIPPGATLAATIAQVQSRLASSTPEPMLPGDVLRVPRINFDLLREYYEIEGLPLILTVPVNVPGLGAVTDGLYILKGLQSIRFQMNEKGVKLRSEAVVAVGCGPSAGGPPESAHIMVFDEPFLIMMKRTTSGRPYFAFWVDNPELLVRQ